MLFDTPVVFIFYNRRRTTQQVFAEIARAKPRRLLLIADGPRRDRLGDAERLAATREIVDHVDWPCDVRKNFSDVNHGCQKRISSGLTWAFDQVEEAIVLEDDCLPNPTCFPFCSELLKRYRTGTCIMAISGNSFSKVNRELHTAITFRNTFRNVFQPSVSRRFRTWTAGLYKRLRETRVGEGSQPMPNSDLSTEPPQAERRCA